MKIRRRDFLAGAGAMAGLGARAGAQPSATEALVQVRINASRTLGAIPPDFMGLGYEISSVARPGLLSASNGSYLQLVRALSPAGVIRVGGNTSDFSSYSPEGAAVSSPKATVINQANLRELRSFLDATGWSLMWGLNLGGGRLEQAVEEAKAVSSAIGPKLLAFEIGNEPDLFGGGVAHRPKGYSYVDYLSEYRRYEAAIREKVPGAPFAGPDAASATDWVTRFASDEGRDLKLLTHHYYRECANPGSTIEKLLGPDPKLMPQLEKLRGASAASGIPYRICEVNSFCGGGKPGVSDTFGSALWVLDYMFKLAFAGAAGVNMETGVNQLGFISSYSPIGDDEKGTYAATPEYYGMLAFGIGSRGERVQTDCDAGGLNVAAYGVLTGPKEMKLTVINKEASRNAQLRITTGFPVMKIIRLTAPALHSKEGVRLSSPASATGNSSLTLPAASAAVITLET